MRGVRRGYWAHLLLFSISEGHETIYMKEAGIFLLCMAILTSVIILTSSLLPAASVISSTSVVFAISSSSVRVMIVMIASSLIITASFLSTSWM